MRRSLLFIFIALLWGSLSWAQSSRPSGAPHGGAPSDAAPQRNWAQAVRALAEAMVQSADGEALAHSLPAGSTIRRFDRPDPQDRLSLRDAVSGASVIMAQGYTSGPATVATDLAEALREASFMPESLRAEFILDGTAAMKRANDTAGHWVMSTLQPGVEQPVGLIALWQERAPETPSQQPQGILIFVLVKGYEIVPNDYRISFVIYGDLGQIVR